MSDFESTPKKLSPHFCIFIFFLVVLSFYVLVLLPGSNEYYYGADEGTYLRIIQTMDEKGIIDGYRFIVHDFINNEDRWDFPNPFRLGYFLLALPFGKGGMFGLSIVSLLCMITVLFSTFFFVHRMWGSRIALISVILLGLSPLWPAIGRRAIADMPMYASLLLAIMAFIWHLNDLTSKTKLFVFLVLLSAAGFVKELSFLTVPFFTGYSFYYHFFLNQVHHSRIRKIIPPALTGFVPVFLFIAIYGYFCTPDGLVALIRVMMQNSLQCEYGKVYGAGGWYQYIIDFFLLSPAGFLLFCAAVLILLSTKRFQFEHKNILHLFLLFWIYIYIIYLFFTKNIRYVGFLEWVHCLLGAILILKVIDRFKVKRPEMVSVLVTLPVLVMNIANFKNIFIDHKVYDTVAYNLWRTQMYFDIDSAAIVQLTTDFSYLGTKKDHQKENIIIPEESRLRYLLNKSLALYNDSDFDSCIIVCRQGLKVSSLPVYTSKFYNNICASYNNLRKYDLAVEAGRKAVELDPGNNLARNNLAYAIREMEKMRSRD